MIVLKLMVAAVLVAALADWREARKQRRIAAQQITIPLASVINL